MPNKLWKIHEPLKLRYPGTKIFQVAVQDEIVEERPGTSALDSSDDVRVYRLDKGQNDFQSFIVSRSDLDARAKLVSETKS
jgi:hypothetical protein